MVACSGDRQGAFVYLLASDIDEIQIVLGVAVVDLFESAWDRIDFQGAGQDKNSGTVPGFLMSILARKCFASEGTVPGFLPILRTCSLQLISLQTRGQPLHDRLVPVLEVVARALA